MSNYQRNTNMVVCIVAVIVVGAIAVGALSYFGTGWFNWSAAKTDFQFDSEVGATTGPVNLDIDLDAGSVLVSFVDDASLLYEIDLEVRNSTIERDGSPMVSFTSNTIALDYTAASVNITLGSGLNYTLDVDTSAGSVSVELVEGAHVGDVAITTEAGDISLEMTDSVVLLGNATFDFETTVGGVDVLVDLPVGVEGSVFCATDIGDVDITAPGWTQVTSNHYKSSGYDTASQALTVLIETEIGSIDATFT